MAEVKRWILIANGEGASSAIVTDLVDGFHSFGCCCGKTFAECKDEQTASIVEEMKDTDHWSRDEAGEPFEFTWPHECGQVTATRLDRDDGYAALEAQLAEAKASESAEISLGLAIDKGLRSHSAGLKAEEEAEIVKLKTALREIRDYAATVDDDEVPRLIGALLDDARAEVQV